LTSLIKNIVINLSNSTSKEETNQSNDNVKILDENGNSLESTNTDNKENN
jgi:hypothetical protein